MNRRGFMRFMGLGAAGAAAAAVIPEVAEAAIATPAIARVGLSARTDETCVSISTVDCMVVDWETAVRERMGNDGDDE